MPFITYRSHDGRTIQVEVPSGTSVMEGAVKNNIPGIDGDCGGACACATCHVYVDEAWLGRLEKPNQDENMMLDEAFEVRDNSRLSCQIKYTESLDGLEVTLAPEF